MENMDNMDINVFPLPFNIHLIFVILAVALFAFQYYRCRRTYQLLIMIAVPVTLLLYINESTAWHYAIGAVEAILIIGAIVTSVFDGIRARREKKALKAAEETATAAEGITEEK